MEKAEGTLSPPGAPKIGEGSTPGTQAGAIKAESTAVKLPKAKKMADGFGKPSLFFKSEQIGDIKHPSVCKLRDFLQNRIGRQSSR